MRGSGGDVIGCSSLDVVAKKLEEEIEDDLLVRGLEDIDI